MQQQSNTYHPLNAVPETENALSALRLGTEDLHRQIERRVNLELITRSVDDYAKMLAAYYGFYQPFERQIENARRALFEFESLARSTQIIRDLHALGQSRLIATLPGFAKIPALETTPDLVGAIYVVEGSSLGGQIIARRVREDLGIDRDSGGSFFAGDGNVGKRWQTFRSAANAAVRTQVEREDGVRAARAVFRAFDDWLASCGLSASIATTKDS